MTLTYGTKKKNENTEIDRTWSQKKLQLELKNTPNIWLYEIYITNETNINTKETKETAINLGEVGTSTKGADVDQRAPEGLEGTDYTTPIKAYIGETLQEFPLRGYG